MNDSPAETPVLLVFGASQEAYRRYILEEILAEHRVILFDTEPSPWAAPLVAERGGHTVLVDLFDHEATSAAVAQVAEQYTVSGVLTYLEHHVELVAELAQQLGLPGAAPEAVKACRDKALTRQLLQTHGVPSARSHPVHNEQEAVEAAHRVGWPVIVKPRGMAASAGVRLCRTEQGVRDAYHQAKSADLQGLEAGAAEGVLVEEYLDSTEEISVETVVRGPGDVHVAFVTRKELPVPPAFQETGHTVDCADELLDSDEIYTVVAGALKAVGITHGVLHIEMRRTAAGWRVVEINARLGGELIPLMVRMITGVSLPQVAAALATGSPPQLTPSPQGGDQKAAGVAFVYPESNGRIGFLDTTADPGRCAWLQRLVWTRKEGDDVLCPPGSTLGDRIVHFIVTGPDAATCKERLELVKHQLTVHIVTSDDVLSRAR